MYLGPSALSPQVHVGPNIRSGALDLLHIHYTGFNAFTETDLNAANEAASQKERSVLQGMPRWEGGLVPDYPDLVI